MAVALNPTVAQPQAPAEVSTAATQPAGTADSPTLDAPFVDRSHAMAVFRHVEEWVKNGAVGAQRPAPMRVSRVLGAKVTLRLQGHTLGTGVAWREDLADVLHHDTAPGAIDLIPLMERAAFAAFNSAQQRLRDAARDALLMARLRPELKGAGDVPTLAEVGPEVTLDLQLMHTPTPVFVADDAPRATVLQRFAPGYHGLIATPRSTALRSEKKSEEVAAVWPATALTQNLSPDRQLRVLVSRLGLPFTEADNLARPAGPMLHRAMVLHVVRPRLDLPPRLMARGNTAAAPSRIDARRLDKLADRIANHLVERFIDRGAVRGTYHPSSDRYGPQLAPLSDAALAAFALAQHHATDARLERPDAEGLRIQTRVDLLLDLAAVDLDAPAEPLVIAPDTAALLTLTRLERRDGQADPISRRFLADVLPQLDDEGRVFQRQRPDDDAPRPASRAATALVALALGRHGIADNNQDLLTRTAAVSQQLWQRGPLQDGNALPWLALLVEEVDPALVAAGLLEPAAYADRRAQLDRAATLLEDFQIIQHPALGPDDVVGGFAIPEPPPGAPPSPTWSTAPLLSFLAVALRLDDDPNAFGRIVTAQYAARFLDRLTFDPDAAFYARAPLLVVGAVRPALHDNRLSVAPSAMTLVALDQLRRTIHERERAAATTDDEVNTDVE